MEETENDKEPDWSQLQTSSQFDPGLDTGQSRLEDMAIDKINKLQSSSNSIFVESLIDQLCNMLEIDPKEKKRAYNAICAKLFELRLIDSSYRCEELATLRWHYSSALTTMIKAPTTQVPLLETSRYAMEYDELAWISSGGFGQVFRARHRLDQVIYAIKKIKVRYSAGMFLRTIAEVKTLARLNHPNIVQYKAAWLEADSVFPFKSDTVIAEATSADESDGVVFLHSSKDSSESSNSNCLAVRRIERPPLPAPHTGAILYVSMQLCDETLRHWLDRRNTPGVKVDYKLALHIIRQAAAGVQYIHSCNVVHHDIKPSNIFITRNHLVQVGDFGLACALQGGTCPVGAGHRGTSLYAAPEQLRGQCHQRSDIFSLGLVLLELISPFATAMERVAELGKARTSQLPKDIPIILQNLLLRLTAANAEERPSADDLLTEMKQLHHAAVSRAEETDKDTTINELKRQLAERDWEIRELKLRLSEEATPTPDKININKDT